MGEESVHLRELAETVGPRPACSDPEARAAAYIRSVMGMRAMVVEDEPFDAPRSRAGAFVICHLLSILGALLSRLSPLLGLAFGLLGAVLLQMEVSGKGTLSAILPKGPSQNVVGRHVPKARRGETVKRVVIVAHYDTARPTLFDGPALSRRKPLIDAVTGWASWLIPLMSLVAMFGLRASWWWYATLAPAVWLVLPLLVYLFSSLSKAVPGANDNASGVAAMLGVMERVVPEVEQQPEAPVRRSEEVAWASDVVPEDALLTYSGGEPAAAPAGGEEDYDIDWSEGPAPVRQQRIDWVEEAPRPAEETPRREPVEETRRREEPRREETAPSEPDWGEDVLSDWSEGPAPAEPLPEHPERGRVDRNSVQGWLGLDEGFDARKEGRKIGSWENIEADDDTGEKGGAAASDALDDPDFATSEASRIRRRVTSGTDHALAEKEVWFVATGASEPGGYGMRVLLKDYAEEMEDALVINLLALGSGTLGWAKSEGGRRRQGSRRIANAARQVARDRDIQYRDNDVPGLSSDAGVAISQGLKALTITAFDINGRIPYRHGADDVVANVSPENLTLAADFVTELIKEL